MIYICPLTFHLQLLTSLVHVPTGASLHTAIYRGASHPISAVKSEHWYAVLFWDTRAHREVLHATELFAKTRAQVRCFFFCCCFRGLHVLTVW